MQYNTILYYYIIYYTMVCRLLLAGGHGGQHLALVDHEEPVAALGRAWATAHYMYVCMHTHDKHILHRDAACPSYL